MSRWHPIASMVTIAPSMTIMSSSFGIATISLDFSATLIWPSTRRWRAAKAETMWIGLSLPLLAGPPGGLAIDGDDPLGGSGQCGYPGDEAALELLVVQHGEDVAKMVVRRRAVGEGTEAAQQAQLLAAEQGDVGDGLRTGQDGD